MFSIRPTELRDAELLPEIERSAGKAFLDIPDLAWIADDEVRSEAWHRHHISMNSSWIGSSLDGAPVGFLCAEVLGRNLHIWEIAVRRRFQRRGLGRMLIEHSARQAKAAGCPALALTTFRGIRWNEPYYHQLDFRTLEAEQLTEELRAILEKEANNGLPRERRCAMARPLP